ncbi:MAG TPA: hypothetical protein VFQ61_29990 [Polyangiaceae bacterium]|nr:hypothetical protein [Polyangiaceae bacterium]
MAPALPSAIARLTQRLFGSGILLFISFACDGCGDQGFLPGTVERGPDFNVAEVVFDAGYYYCKVEPMLVERRCGPGDSAQGDPAGGCHANVTSYRLTEYMPLVADSCTDGLHPDVSPSAVAQQNYQASQVKMRRDPDAAPLLMRPTGRAQHPRTLFDTSSAEADLIRTWATQYSTQ